MIIETKKSVIIPPPDIGTYLAVLAEVYDLGMMAGKFGEKPKLWLVWQLVLNSLGTEAVIGEEGDFKGKRYEVRDLFTKSLSRSSNLRKRLNSWRGDPLTDEEVAYFDTDRIVGSSSMLVIGSHSKPRDDGRVFANVSSVLPPVIRKKADGSWSAAKVADIDGETVVVWKGELREYVPIAERGGEEGNGASDEPAELAAADKKAKVSW